MALPRTGQGSAHRLLFFPAVARIRSRGREHQAHFLLPVLAMRGTIHRSRSRCPFRLRAYETYHIMSNGPILLESLPYPEMTLLNLSENLTFPWD